MRSAAAIQRLALLRQRNRVPGPVAAVLTDDIMWKNTLFLARKGHFLSRACARTHVYQLNYNINKKLRNLVNKEEPENQNHKRV